MCKEVQNKISFLKSMSEIAGQHQNIGAWFLVFAEIPTSSS
jgi:hypothetical protein